MAGLQNAFTATAIREALFVAGYLELSPLLKNKFEEIGASPSITTAGSSVTSGLLATAASHPFDTYKTNRQSDFS